MTLDDLEGAFNRTPSITTAQAWMDAAIDAFKLDNIQLNELQLIGAAVRAWARKEGIHIPE